MSNKIFKNHILYVNKTAAYLLTAVFVLTISTQICRADLFSGYLTGDGGGLTATDGWVSTSTKISWNVSLNSTSTAWIYSYTFETPIKEVSHIIFEVSPNFTLADYLSPLPAGQTGSGEFLNTYTPGGSNPGMPSNIYGIKFDDLSGLTWSVTFESTRAPTWGNFYAKDGTLNVPGGTNIDVYAYNTGWNTAGGSFISVPDTNYIPVPPAAILGIIGICVAGIKLRKYA